MYISGKNVAKEYLNAFNKINKAFLYNNFNDLEIKDLLNSRKVKINYLDKKEMDKLTKENHQGIILEVEDFEYTDLSEVLKRENALLVMLDHIQDPHNFGAIIRTSEAAGVDGIIIPKDRSVSVNGTVIKTSVGASKYVPIIRVTNLVQTIKELKKEGFWFFGTDMNGENYSKLDYGKKCCLVIGNEGSGMSKLVKENCDFIASIPMIGKINSLNASVAAGIIIYKAVESRNELQRL